MGLNLNQKIIVPKHLLLTVFFKKKGGLSIDLKFIFFMVGKQRDRWSREDTGIHLQANKEHMCSSRNT